MGEIGEALGGIAIGLRPKNTDALVFNVFTGELITVPALKYFGADGRYSLHFTYPPACWPVLGNIQPRYDLNGKYIGFTNDDSGEIKKLMDPMETLARGTLKLKKGWLLIGAIAFILLLITLLLIIIIIGSNTLTHILATVQIVLFIVSHILPEIPQV